MRRLIRCVALAASLAAGCVLASGDEAAAAAKKPDVPKSARKVQLVGEEAAAVKTLFESKFPPAEAAYVGKSPYFGLYEVVVGDTTIYTDAKVSYIIVGTVIDANNKINLSEQRLSKVRAIAWAELPLELAIKSVKGNGARKLAIFADADCPFCRKLETEMKAIDNVTIYTFLYPIDSLHPDANRKSKLIWCAPDRDKAWKEWIMEGKLPAGEPGCETPLERVAALGAKFNVKATPTLVFIDGHVTPGALPLARLERELQEAEVAVLKKTGAAEKAGAKTPEASADKTAQRAAEAVK